MTGRELYQQLLQTTERDALKPMFKELLENKDDFTNDFLAIADEIFTEPARLASEPERRAFYAVLLYLVRQRQEEHNLGARLFQLCLTPEFSQHITQNDWLAGDLSRLLGSSLPKELLPELFAAVRNESLAVFLREHLLMTILYRMLGKYDARSEYIRLLKELLNQTVANRLEPNLWLALLITSLSVGDDSLKVMVHDYCQRTIGRYRADFSEKLIRGFFQMDPIALRQMLLKEYMEDFGTPEEEVERMFALGNGEDVDTSVLRAPKPIVRESPKINRNDPCPCGSGKKYKKCCGR